MKTTNQQGTCPICNGTTEVDGRDCRNCGGQKQYGVPTGSVYLREDGTPCVHEYKSWTTGRCLTAFRCKHCLDSFTIDSGD